MYAASLAKQVVGVLVALLVRDGRLGVEDRLRLHVPELPAWAEAVRVRHLLHHTSGLPDVERRLTGSARPPKAAGTTPLRCGRSASMTARGGLPASSTRTATSATSVLLRSSSAQATRR